MFDRSPEAFLDDLLEFVEDGKVVPIIGEELLRVRHDGREIPLDRFIADKLAERLEIPAASLSPEPGLNAVVCHYLQTGGVQEEIYPKIRSILNQARFAPPEALLQLARIDRFKLFVTSFCCASPKASAVAARTEMELLVGSLANRDSDLVVFLRHFSPQTKIASCSPAEFVGELTERYTDRAAGSAAASANLPSGAAIRSSDGRETGNAARRLSAPLDGLQHPSQVPARGDTGVNLGRVAHGVA